MFKVQNKNFGKVGNLSTVSNNDNEVRHLFKVNIRDTIKSVCNLLKFAIKMLEQHVQSGQS